MAQAMFNVYMDEKLKNQFDALCADFGMNASAAINILAAEAVRKNKIAFEMPIVSSNITRENALQAFAALRSSARENGLQNMPLAAINEEIRLSRYEQENSK